MAALLGAVLIQIGTNLSNDYSDARRGADSDDRIGPVRVTAGGLVPPHQVLVATYLTFAAAVLCGVYLIAVAGWLLLAVGAASILAGILYTGGPRPYGYEGLGEVFVFLFFGVVAVTGSDFVQRHTLPWEAFVLSVPVGLLIAAILVVNNVRDIDSDRRAGKRTLAVRLGRQRTRGLFMAMLVTAFVTSWVPWMAGALSPWLFVTAAAIPLAWSVARTVRSHADGPSLNGALAATAKLALIFCLLLCAGVLASWLAPFVRGGWYPPGRGAGWRSGAPVVATPAGAPSAAPPHAGPRDEARVPPRRPPLLDPAGGCAERCAPASLVEVTLTDDEGAVGRGEAAALEAYDGVSRPIGFSPRWRPTARRSPNGRDAAGRWSSTPAAARLPVCRRRSRRSTSRCGTWRATERGARSASC